MASDGRPTEEILLPEIISQTEPLLQPLAPEIEHISDSLTTVEDRCADFDDHHPRYSNRAIEQTVPGSERAQTFRTRMSKRSTILLVQQLLAFLITLANAALTTWAFLKQKHFRQHDAILIGSCHSISRIDAGVHVLLNVLSTLFLGAGNYCMQILSAPSREEAVRAHAEGRFMEIGIPNLRNLLNIERTRTAIWAAIGVVTTILHLFWNSAFYVSIPFVVFPVVTVTSDFLVATDNWEASHPIIDPTIIANSSSIYALHEKAKHFTRLENRQCMEKYIDPLTATSELVLVSTTTTQANNRSSLIWGWISGSDSVQWNEATGWICENYGDFYCTIDGATKYTNDWVVRGGIIDHCLIGQQGNNANRCDFNLNTDVMCIVSTFTLAGSLLIAWTAHKHRQPTLVTIGDAAAEFLEKQDGTTAADLTSGSRTSKSQNITTLGVGEWQEIRISFFRAVSFARWIVSMTFIVLGLILGIALFSKAMTTLQQHHIPTSLSALWKAGLGRTHQYEIIGSVYTLNSSRLTLFWHVLFANIFQVMISFLYLFVNGILTCQLVADEWTRFLRQKKPLRVTSPVGFQRSSYTISLPLKYAIPLMVSFMATHWLVSQSVFIVQTTAYGPGPNGQRIESSDASRIGFSAIGILLSTLLMAIILMAMILNSFRKYRPCSSTILQMATNSSAISAACHPPDGDTEAYLFPLSLGAVYEDPKDGPNSMQRITFSTDIKVKRPINGLVYRQPTHGSS